MLRVLAAQPRRLEPALLGAARRQPVGQLESPQERASPPRAPQPLAGLEEQARLARPRLESKALVEAALVLQLEVLQRAWLRQEV